MADFDLDDPDETSGWWEMDADDDASGTPEMVPMETLVEKDMVIDDLLSKFGGNLDDTERALMRLQLNREDNSWFYNTELSGQAVKLKLTGVQGQVLAKSSIQKAKGGADFFQALGPTGSPRTRTIPLEPTIVDRLDSITLQQEIETIIDDDDSPLRPQDRRELRGVATTLASTSSKVKAAAVNSEWAKSELEKARKELQQAQDDEQMKYWAGEVSRFDTQEILYRRTHEALQQTETSQLARMKTLLRNLRDDTRPLGQRLRELFEREGVTIISLVTAAVMTVTAIGLGIATAVRSVTAASPVTPPDQPVRPTFRDRIRDALRKLAGYLKELAKKGAAALPGLIGSVVGFVLRKAGEVVGYLADHLVIILIAIVALVFEGVQKRFST